MIRPVVLFLITAAIAVNTLAPAGARAQAEPEKRPGPAPQQGPKAPPAEIPQPGPVGAPEAIDPIAVKADIDSTMQRMDKLIAQSVTLSASFAQIATLHHGADRSEILVMQRVSDAMGAMAGELKTTLVQYKRMLDDETSTESGAMKSEVDGLNAAMQVIAGEVGDAIQTLHRLEAQLGQG
jgi:hypothetical protein